MQDINTSSSVTCRIMQETSNAFKYLKVG